MHLRNRPSGLENRSTGNGTQGSNPCLSALGMFEGSRNNGCLHSFPDRAKRSDGLLGGADRRGSTAPKPNATSSPPSTARCIRAGQAPCSNSSSFWKPDFRCTRHHNGIKLQRCHRVAYCSAKVAVVSLLLQSKRRLWHAVINSPRGACCYSGSTRIWLRWLSSISGKSLRAWTPRLSRRSRALAAMARPTSIMFWSSQPAGSLRSRRQT